MHVILGLIAILTVAAGIIFWLRMISRATKDAIKLSEDVQAAFHRFGFSANPKQIPQMR